MRYLPLILALLLTACAPTANPRTQAPDFAAIEAPALWRLSDEDTTIYLFGTIHLLPQDFVWRNETIDAAVAASDELVIETQFDADQDEATMLLMRLGITNSLPPIRERLAPENIPAFEAMLARGTFQENFLNGLDTWAAALMLVGITLGDLGLNSENGVEEQLQQTFRLANRPINGLETPAQQLGFFDNLPEDAQRQFLVSVIDTPEDVRAEFAQMLEAWRTGDEPAIAATFDDELVLSEPLRQALLVTRNADWARQIEARLDQPGTVFVAVGAGHLVGRDSVQVFLDRNGIHTTRIQ